MELFGRNGGFGVWESWRFLQEIHNTKMLDVLSSFIEILQVKFGDNTCTSPISFFGVFYKKIKVRKAQLAQFLN